MGRKEEGEGSGLEGGREEEQRRAGVGGEDQDQDQDGEEKVGEETSVQMPVRLTIYTWIVHIQYERKESHVNQGEGKDSCVDVGSQLQLSSIRTANFYENLPVPEDSENEGPETGLIDRQMNVAAESRSEGRSASLGT